MSNGDEAANEFWRCKYLKILEYAYQVLQNNKLQHAKIKRINKNVRRISKHNQYFVQVLKRHGDDFGLHCPSVWEKIAYPGAISEPLLDAKAQMKKPPNAFFLYCKENRDSVKKLIKEQPAGMFDARNEITRQLAKDWNALPQEEREKYFEKYRDNIEQYEESIREERRKNKLMFAMTSSEDEEDDEFAAFCQTPTHPSQTPYIQGYNPFMPSSSQPPLTPHSYTPQNNTMYSSSPMHPGQNPIHSNQNPLQPSQNLLHPSHNNPLHPAQNNSLHNSQTPLHPSQNQLYPFQTHSSSLNPPHSSLHLPSNSSHSSLHLPPNSQHSSLHLPPNFLQLNQSAQLSESDDVFEGLFPPVNGVPTSLGSMNTNLSGHNT